MLLINLYKNKNENSAKFGRIYGRVKNASPIDVKELAKHMSEHNTPYSPGVIAGILTDMVSCIKELCLLGQPVKIADLGIFSAEVTSDSSADAKSFNISEHIKNVRLLVKSTGETVRMKMTEGATIDYTDLAKKIRNGEAILSNNKKEYLVPVNNG